MARKKKEVDPLTPKFTCQTEMTRTHTEWDRDNATDSKRGLICTECMKVFRRTKSGVSHFNLFYALPGKETTLDVEASILFANQKAITKKKIEEERKDAQRHAIKR